MGERASLNAGHGTRVRSRVLVSEVGPQRDDARRVADGVRVVHLFDKVVLDKLANSGHVGELVHKALQMRVIGNALLWREKE